MPDYKTCEITFGSATIRYILHYSNRKTLGIQVHPDSSVVVVAPYQTTGSRIEETVKRKAPWILKQLRELEDYKPFTPARRYVNGETHRYLGRQYRLQRFEGTKNYVRLYQGRLELTLKPGCQPEKVLNQWYKAKARDVFDELLDESIPAFRAHKISGATLKIRSMKTRWGSWPGGDRIVLNPELVKASKRCIRYVIIHELCHRVHPNHSRNFYNLLTQKMPDWQQVKHKLETQLS